ncbi:hypothetical protein LINPERHAP2_LOCUS19062 [Linum perenne]
MATWNVACVARHIWSILSQSGSIWIVWVNRYRLKGTDIWVHKSAPYNSWVWRRIMKVRKEVPLHIALINGELTWDGKPLGKYSITVV